MPDEEELKKKADECAQLVEDTLPGGVGFALLVFPIGDGGQAQYVSNVDRVTSMEQMRAFLKEDLC